MHDGDMLVKTYDLADVEKMSLEELRNRLNDQATALRGLRTHREADKQELAERGKRLLEAARQGADTIEKLARIRLALMTASVAETPMPLERVRELLGNVGTLDLDDPAVTGAMATQLLESTGTPEAKRASIRAILRRIAYDAGHTRLVEVDAEIANQPPF